MLLPTTFKSVYSEWNTGPQGDTGAIGPTGPGGPIRFMWYGDILVGSTEWNGNYLFNQTLSHVVSGQSYKFEISTSISNVVGSGETPITLTIEWKDNSDDKSLQFPCVVSPNNVANNYPFYYSNTFAASTDSYVRLKLNFNNLPYIYFNAFLLTIIPVVYEV